VNISDCRLGDVECLTRAHGLLCASGCRERKYKEGELR